MRRGSAQRAKRRAKAAEQGTAARADAPDTKATGPPVEESGAVVLDAEGMVEPVLLEEESGAVVLDPEGTMEPVLLEDDGHASRLQACSDAPAQVAPPSDGAGLEQLRVCVPLPHGPAQTVQLDQPPLVMREHGTPVFLPARVLVTFSQVDSLEPYLAHKLPQSEQVEAPRITPL